MVSNLVKRTILKIFEIENNFMESVSNLVKRTILKIANVKLHHPYQSVT